MFILLTIPGNKKFKHGVRLLERAPLAVSQHIKWHDVVEVYSRGKEEAKMRVWFSLFL